MRAHGYIRRAPALLGMLGLALVPGLGCIAGGGEAEDEDEDLAEAALALCVPADCDDGNTCTDDVCTSSGCSHTPRAVKTPCSDGNACTRDDQCDATGVCAGNPLGGSEPGGCTIRTCDPDTGPVDTPVPEGTWCTDHNPCTIGDQCDGGGHCLGAPAPTGTGCDDGRACTVSDQCDAAGACVGAAVANGTACDEQSCWVETCLNGACTRTGALDPDGTSCSDAPCTAGQTCLSGSCQGGTQLGEGAPCSDGNACNGAETCNSAGACEPGSPLLVGDGQPCTLDICDPGTGALTHPVAGAGAPCSDGDLCNGDEACDGNGPGSAYCLPGSPLAVDDGNPCTLDTCDPVTGVKHAACTPVDRTIATSVYDTTSFLYGGWNPIQTNADPFAFDPKRASVIRGKVSTSAGAPLMGVTIKPAGQPQWGWTTTQANGNFDLAVNGGSTITLSYEKEGYLPARRTVEVPWQAYAWASDVVLIQPDPAQPVSLSAGGAAQGATTTDSFGPRRGALLFASGTTAAADGSPLPANVSVRITEYTVGASGPSAMPAELPPTSGYTYAVEYGIDEAGGAATIQFNQPVHAYVDNFLNLPVGIEVPAGYYDKVKGAWIPSTDGKVISILSFTSGAADVDTDGNGTADNSGMLLEERQQLYALHQGSSLPKTLWRVPITHFSIWDFNFPMGPPPGATGPEGKPVGLGDFFGKACKKSGSIVGCHNQVLGESLPLVGTPYSLGYSSDRAPGYKAAYTLKIPRTGAIVPASLQAVDVEVEIAGQKHSAPTLASPSNSPNDFWLFTWDGKDAYGRVLQGKQPVTVRVIYSYPGEYHAPAASPASSFAGFGDYALGIGSREGVRIARIWRGFLGTFDAAGLKLGGWTVDTHHAYDPISRTLYLGTGEQQSVAALGSKLEKAAGGGATLGDGAPAIQAKISQPFGIAAAADGSLYVVDQAAASDGTGMRIRRIALNGIIETVAGTGQASPGTCPPDGPATSVNLGHPKDIVAAPDGALYFSETAGSNRVRKLHNGEITTVAGGANNCDAWWSGDGGPATSARMWNPRGLALAPDGTLYIADSTNAVIRRVTPDGIIATVAGVPWQSGDSGDGGPALNARLQNVRNIALSPDGSLYLTQDGYHRVRRIRPDGIIEAFAGMGSQGYSASDDGGQAVLAMLNGPQGLAVAPDGSVYIADTGNARVRKVSPDGIITTVVGNGTSTTDGAYGGPPTTGSLHLPTEVAVAPDGSLIIGSSSRVKKVTAALPGYTGAGDIAVPSEDGNALYTFDALGRHVSTRDAMTGAVLRTFGYTGTLLTSITEVAGNTTTTIQRDGAGQPTGITGPYQQASGITLVPGSSYLWTLTNPNSETFTLTYVGGDGLLDTLTTPRNHTYNFDYDLAGMGRLTSDLDPAGGSLGLSRTDTSTSYAVAVTRAVSGSISRTTDYELQSTADGRTIRSSTWPDDVVVSTTTDASKVSTTTFDDGTVVTLTKGPDDRFGMSAPIPAAFKVETGGKTFEMQATRSTTWDGTNPLSITGRVDTLQFKEGAAWRTFTSTFAQASGSSLAQYTIETPVGRKRYTRLDAMGRIKEDELQDLGPVVYEYDGNGRLWTVTHKHRTQSSEDRTYELLYDTSGRLETVRDPYNVQIAALVYDGANRPTSLTEPGPVTTGMGYDANGNPTVVTPPGKLSHGLLYSPVDVLTQYTPPSVPGIDVAATTYSPTLDRRLDRAVLPNLIGEAAVTVDVGYDNVGRVATLTTANDDVPYAVTYGYALATDPEAGKLRTVAGPAGVTITYGYNQSLPITTDWSGLGVATRRVHRDFDDLLRVTGESLRDDTGAILPGGGTITYGYDNDGALLTAGSLSITRNTTNGLLGSVAIGDITTAVTSYSDFAEPLSVADRRSGTAFFTVDYTGFDKRGRITGRSEVLNTGGGPVTTTWSYEYDDTPGGGPGRLWKATKNGVTTTYTYDANGNRTGAGWAYDDQDRLTASPGGVTYTYSANGELATRTDAAGMTTYAYDALGNLRFVYRPAPAATIEYIVDGLNRRVGKKVGGVLQQVFLYDEADRIVAELDGAGAVVSRFVYGTRPHVPESMVKNGTTYRLVTDHLGSVRLVVQVGAAALTIAQQCEYDPWGQVTCSQGSGSQPFGFAGGLYDPDTGLVRFGARDYDPAVGRWTAKDPVGFGGGDANLYAYVGDDPVNFVDPSGASRVSAIGLSHLHTALSIAGMVPWVGEFFDATDAALYMAEGDCLNAGISMAAAIPGLGNAVTAGRLAARGAGETISMYRAVSPAEFYDIMKTGGFRPAPGGGSLAGKQFGLSLDEVLKFADLYPDLAAIVRVDIPKSTFAQFDFSRSIDPFIFKSGVVTVQPGAQLAALNQTLLSIWHAL